MKKVSFEVVRSSKFFRLRKIIVTLKLCPKNDVANVVDSRRMFGWPFFEKRLARKQKRMLRFAAKMLEGWSELNV